MKKTRHNPERSSWRGKSHRKAGNGPATAQRVRDLKEKEAQRVARSSAKPTDKFGVWKTKAALFAKTHPALRLDDILAPDDPYELAEAMPAAFAAGQTPEDFIEEVFEEDITSREYDEHLANEAYEHELAELGLDAQEDEPRGRAMPLPAAHGLPRMRGTPGQRGQAAAPVPAGQRSQGRFQELLERLTLDQEHRESQALLRPRRRTDTKQMRRRGFAKASLIRTPPERREEIHTMMTGIELMTILVERYSVQQPRRARPPRGFQLKTTEAHTMDLHDAVEQRAKARSKRLERERAAWLQLAAALRARGVKVRCERVTGRIRAIDEVECTGYSELVNLTFPYSAGGSMGVLGAMPFSVRKDIPGNARRPRPTMYREPKEGFDFARIANAVIDALAHRQAADKVRQQQQKDEISRERVLRALKRRAPELAAVLDGTVNVGQQASTSRYAAFPSRRSTLVRALLSTS